MESMPMSYNKLSDASINYGSASVLYADEMPYESPWTCLSTCITDCCVPVTAFCCVPCKLCSPPCDYSLNDGSWKPTKFRLCHKLQSWLLRHPFTEGNCFCCIRPIVTIHDMAGYGTTMIKEFRSEVGEWWCDNMKVQPPRPTHTAAHAGATRAHTQPHTRPRVPPITWWRLHALVACDALRWHATCGALA